MWLFTKIGFYSVVCARLDGGKGAPDKSRLMVRARDVQHLRALQSTFPDVFTEPIHESAGSDYPARLFVGKAEFSARVMPKLAEMIDYDNFKGKLTATGQHKYHDACSSVWGVMLRLQAPRKKFTQPSLFDRDDRSVDRDRWWEKRGSRTLPASEPEPVEAPTPDVAPLVGRLHNPDDHVVVGVWSKGGAVTQQFVLTDVGHYRRSRVAVRDAADRGWCSRIPRSQLCLTRLSPADAQRLYPNLKRVSMKGVLPSVGQPAHLAHRANGSV